MFDVLVRAINRLVPEPTRELRQWQAKHQEKAKRAKEREPKHYRREAEREARIMEEIRRRRAIEGPRKWGNTEWIMLGYAGCHLLFFGMLAMALIESC
ncbi:MAG: hypothetical protein OXF27_21095 [Acidobacteria bacterium]|nr:hypothetical protein [Acidobacteriota bacterium]